MRKPKTEQRRENQLTVGMTRDERLAIERLAKSQDRSLGYTVRLLLNEGLRHFEQRAT